MSCVRGWIRPVRAFRLVQRTGWAGHEAVYDPSGPSGWCKGPDEPGTRLDKTSHGL